MYTRFFGLKEKPFSITPDPRYLYMSERHREALAHLVYGVTESGGFIQLTGEVGTGKTTLVRVLLQERLPESAEVALVLNPQLSGQEFLETICQELHLLAPIIGRSCKGLIDTLNRHLLKVHAAGRRTVLVVDEAQNLAPDVLEQVRLLTNLETETHKLLQIILIGQPELRDLLARPDLRQLAQRITGRYHLEPLSRRETGAYVEHRLRVAGAEGTFFSPRALGEVFRHSKGVPRLINVICDRALLGAYTHETRLVTSDLVRLAAAEVSGALPPPRYLRWLSVLAGAFGMGVLALSLWLYFHGEFASPFAAPADGTGVAPATHTPEQIVLAPTASETRNARAQDEAQSMGETLHEQLTIARDLTSKDIALQTLFELWGLAYEGNSSDACAQARLQAHDCLQRQGTWSTLAQLNRPAVLKLTDLGGKTHYVVLMRIGDGDAQVSIGGVDVAHEVAHIAKLWSGHYFLLWKPPNPDPGVLARGVEGPSVAWLRHSLAELNERYLTEPLDSETFDANLEAQLREFQRDHNMDVSGFASRRTQIVIGSMSATDETPRLRAAVPQRN